MLFRVLMTGAVAACAQPALAQPAPPAAGGVDAVQVAGPRRGGGGWGTEASITSLATLTNNANYGSGATADRVGDLILEFIPALTFNREAGRLKVNGSVVLDMLGYVDGTQVSRILPTADVFASLEAVEKLFYVDAAFVTSQLVENPYLPGGSGFASANNLYTSSQARLAPYVKGTIGPNVNWQVRSDNTYTWTSLTEDSLSDVYYARNLAEIVRSPTPFGLTLRLTNDITRVKDQVQPDQSLAAALAVFNYAFSPQLVVGLRGGYENTTYTAVETSGVIYGANLDWQPSPLTRLVGYWEERFYGPSYQLDYSHRQLRVGSSFSFYRTITTFPQVLFQIPATDSVSRLLDSILVARYPDPVDRASQVQDLIARQGLPQSLPAGTYIYNQSANILTGGSVNCGLIGVRNTLALSLFYLKTELLPDARLPPSFVVVNNSIQQGGGLNLSHRLSPTASLSASLSTTLTRGFDENEGLSGRENVASLQFNWQASLRSTLFIGARYQARADASAALARTESSEAAIFTGLFHRL